MAVPAVTAPAAAYPDGGAIASPSNVATPFGPAPAAAAPTLPPGGYSAAPGAVYAPGPEATLGAVQPPPGSMQPPPANWDPVSAPGVQPPPLVPGQDPYYANPNCPQPCQPAPIFTMPPIMTQTYKFVQDIGIDYHWFAGHGSSTSELGINDIDTWVTFALPLPWQNEPPILVTPGFAWHFWDGPSSNAPGQPDMPARTYDAYLQADWNPVIVPNAFSAELEASIGLYTDFTTLTNQSYRIKGKGMAVVAIPDTKLTLKAGVWYINRGYIKLLPAGGFVWKPSEFTEFDILFPNPRFTQMLFTQQNGTQWWWYLSGEYGGGVWTIKRSGDAPASEVGKIDLVDYNDIRAALGINFKRCAGQTGFCEFGYAFNRQLVYASGLPSTFTPDGTFYIHAGAEF